MGLGDAFEKIVDPENLICKPSPQPRRNGKKRQEWPNRESADEDLRPVTPNDPHHGPRDPLGGKRPPPAALAPDARCSF